MKMNKMVKKLVILFIVLSLVFLANNNVYASSASLSAPGSVKEGETFTVTLNVPGDASGASATISCCGQTKKIAYVKGMDGFGNSVSFKAQGTGTVTISASSINISGKDGNKIESGGSASTSISIVGNTPASTPVPTQAPTQVSTPVPTSEPTKVPEQAPVVTSTPAPTPVPTKTPTQAPTPAPTKEPSFKNVDDKVYATKSMNVRESWSKTSKKIGGLDEGQEVTRTGIGDNGWSRIKYNGKTAYVSTGLITTTKPEVKPEETTEDEKENENESETESTTVEETPVDETENSEAIEEIKEELPKTEEEIYAEIVGKIGTIPEVGENVNIKYFIGCAAMSIGLIFVIFRKEA